MNRKILFVRTLNPFASKSVFGKSLLSSFIQKDLELLRKHFDMRVVDFVLKKTKVIKPVGYLDMLILEENAKKILTDSGGMQKEAYIFKVPCVTLRENTEWAETIEEGWNVLVGADKERIIKMVNDFEPKGEQRDVFGSGDASEKIRKIIGGLQ